MSDRYTKKFALQKKAFIPFTLLGWPDMEHSFEMIKTMIDSHVFALELGFPFSDPMSDGPVIQAAASDALNKGFTVDAGFELLKQVRQLDADIPIGLLVYYNLILAKGAEAFFSHAAQAGADSILIPDLPPELAEEVYPFAQKYGIQLIFIVAPLTSPERLHLILNYAGGFLYIVSRLGITGTEARYDDTLKTLLAMVKCHTNLPCCVGFGISTPAQAQAMIDLGADGVITGSRVIQLVEEKQDMKEFFKEMAL